MQNDKLLNCPFCDSKEVRLLSVNQWDERSCYIDSEEELDDYGLYAYIHCYGCDIDFSFDAANCPRDVVSLFNKRKPMERIVNRLEEFKEEKNDIGSKIRNAEDKRCYGFYELGIDEATDIVRKGGVDNAG